MSKKTVSDIDLKGEKVLMRADFNVPLDENGIITDETRSLPCQQLIIFWNRVLQ